MYQAADLCGLVPDPWEQTNRLGKCFAGNDAELKPTFKIKGRDLTGQAELFFKGRYGPDS